VAAAVRAQLDLGTPTATTSRAAIWLLGPPPLPHVHREVWLLTCLAALAAMEYGRELLWARLNRPSTTLVSDVPSMAVARFWLHLSDFAHAHPTLWVLPSSHPFLCTQDGRLTVHVPLAAAAPPTTDS
jgi:hypothetical protein